MNVFNTTAELTAHLTNFKNKKIGLVPTMGALHTGHLSLISKSTSQNDITVVSIFVNPTQFNNQEDLQKYPRTLDADIQKISTLHSNIVIFAPSVEDIYQGNTVSQKFDLGSIANVMEGASRPGHFDGVCTIVKKLFQIVNPTNAYFGEKDFQQILIIEKMVSLENLPVKIVRCPIVREESGLALSSRNQRLCQHSKDYASFIYQSLTQAQKIFASQGLLPAKQLITDLYSENPFLSLEYFIITEEDTLQEASQIDPKKHYRAFIVASIDGVRLIDNLRFQ